MAAKVCRLAGAVVSTVTVAPLEITSQCAGAVTVTSKVALQVGLVEAREHPLGVGGFELRVQVHLVVDRVDEPVQALAGVGVAAVGVDDQHVVLGQTGQRDAGRLVVARHVDVATVEGRAADAVGGDVDVGVGAGQRVELDGRRRPERVLAGLAVAVGQVEVDAVVVDGDQRGAFDGLVASEIGECHESNLVAGPRGRPARGRVSAARSVRSVRSARSAADCSRIVPLPSDVIIDGQYIDMAMPVKNAAMSGLMPLLETLE